MNSVSFLLRIPTQVSFGVGRRSTLPDLLRQNGWVRVGLVVDHALRLVEPVATLISQVQSNCDYAELGWCEISDPTYDALEALRGQFVQRDLQVIVGIGGGSTLDMAKGIAVLVHNSGPALQYRGVDRSTAPVLPVVAVPTTAGTGSEVTPNASFIDLGEMRKLGINGEMVRPRYAILDPELTLTCPGGASLSAGADGLVHSTEAYVARATNPIARLFAREGFGRTFNALPRVIDSPNDLEARTEAMYGAFLAGVALMHSGTGPAAAMSYPLSVHNGVPHGLGGAIFLPVVAAHNVRCGVHDYADLYQTMHDADLGLSRERQAECFVERLSAAWRSLGVPGDLRSIGLAGDGVERFVRETLDLKGALEQNPVAFGEAEIRTTVRRMGGVR